MRKLLGFIVAIAATFTADLAMAADLPLTEPPPAPPIPMQSDISVHGFSDTTLKNDYITPRGLLVTNKGATVQSVDVLIVDVYNKPNWFLYGRVAGWRNILGSQSRLRCPQYDWVQRN